MASRQWRAFELLVLMILGTSVASAADWTTYRADVARSGITSDTIQTPLVESWVFEPRFAPRPAWGDPKVGSIEGYQELRRRHFDDVFHVAKSGGAVFFGSSAENKVYCLDAKSGKIRWTFITGGPVRLAPTVVDGRVYFGSDDGWAYCLDAADGSIEWRFHAAAEDKRVLGSGRMVSLWPLRTGVTVDSGIAYFGSGLFPGEGVFLFAVDAETGKEIWRNDTCGETPQSRISPQGYLLASKTTLYAPMGRVSPAAFDRADGRLKSITFFGKSIGGTYALLAGDDVYTGTEEMIGYRGETRDRFASFKGRKLVVTEKIAYVATETHVSAFDRKTFPNASRTLLAVRARKISMDQQARGNPNLKPKAAELAEQLEKAEAAFAKTQHWTLECPCHESLILTAEKVLAGGNGQVVAIDATSGKQVWSASVDGTVKGLAVSDGRLWASSDTGKIYCFAPKGTPQHGAIREPSVKDPFPKSASRDLMAEAAERIIERSKTRKGYCLVLGLETGQLAVEIAKRTEMMVYAVDPNAEKVAAARRAVDAAGLYGGRVCVETWPLDAVPYSDYFANLIVSETALATGRLTLDVDEVFRMLKPIGGTLVLGKPDGGGALDADVLSKWVAKTDLVDATIGEENGAWLTFVRGPLEGAGSWTHLYGEPGNSGASDDRLVKSPLGVLWFGNPGPGTMVNRHRRAVGPLTVDGRVIIQGENVVMAHDVYNGTELWHRKIPGVMRVNASHDGGNLALTSDGLFMAIGDACLRLDPATGETAARYQIPKMEDGSARRWGVVAVVGDRLIGTRASSGTEADRLFAIDLKTGKIVWNHQGGRIAHNSVTLGDGRVYFAEKNVSTEQRNQAIEAQRNRIKDLPESERVKAEKALANPDVRLIVALDLQSGETKWEQPVDLTHCGEGGLSAMYGDGKLVLFGVYLDGHYWKQFFAGQFASRRVTVLGGEDGKFRWSKPVGYRVRPLILGDTLHAEPWAFDLSTGEQRTRVHPITGETGPWQFARPGHHCGLPIASPNCLFFRSYTLGYYDLTGDSGTMHFGAQRPGCWINFLPAAGLLIFPEASTGCMCPFPNMCSVAFQPVKKNKAYTYYSAVGSTKPVKHLALNFGAAGDRRASDDTLWLGYPRPSGSLVLQLKTEVSFYRGGSYTARNSSYTPIENTEKPWLFSTVARGVRKCVVPLADAADGLATYQVRLSMVDPKNDASTSRPFDIKLQDRVVLENFDLSKAAGGHDRAVVRQFDQIEASDNLTIELVSKLPSPTPEQAPVLAGIELIRQRVMSLGCSVPKVMLSSLKPRQEDVLRLTNLRDDDFQGRLKTTAPKGFSVEFGHSAVKLASGERASVPLVATVSDNVPAGKYEAIVELLRPDGTLELRRTIPIDHLGRRGRIVLKVIEDADAQRRYPDRNRGTSGAMMVDGGDRRMGDEHHSLVYLKFRLDVPGKPISAELRIQNAGNPSGNSGRVCLVTEPWSETKLTYNNRPKPAAELAQLGRVTSRQLVVCPLSVEQFERPELSLMIDPTSTDGVDYLSRESGNGAELIIEYEPK